MKLKRIKRILLSKLSTSYDFPSDEVLSDYFTQAFYFVCSFNGCEPAVLMRSYNERFNESDPVLKVARRNSFYITVPQIPNFANEDEQLMIDEILSFAVIDYVAFLISKEEVFYKNAMQIVQNFIENDINIMEEQY